ncbi:hypothetical protein Nepgr_032097 [Nepenthes gracilis]|uniref:Reverse transcriptase domain-containing protein n=1 Tax=Nepenthes gracilis TaxID=150966 RepID=A0AAD3Y7L9_NEPGR|nr:hypothetical protein Nepgr_032097 [Nepenthes gracilis]
MEVVFKYQACFFSDDVLLFAKANKEQAAIVREVLDSFYTVLGLNINPSKSLLFCSPSVQNKAAKEMQGKYGFRTVSGMWEFLAAKIIHRPVSNNLHQEIIDGVRMKLMDWSSRFPVYQQEEDF